MTPSLAIIIVNWNTGGALRDCIRSIKASDKTGFSLKRITVVDNHSWDHSLALLNEFTPAPDLIQNPSNRGFAAACNQGARHACAEYLLFLNPDTRLLEDTLARAIAWMEEPEHSRTGICGVRLIDERRQAMFCGGRFPTLPGLIAEMLGLPRLAPWIFKPRLVRAQELPGGGKMDQIIGAFFLVRRSAFEACRGFDERFFMYYEEVDFSLRARMLGYTSYCLADTAAVHIGGVSSRQVKAQRLFYSLQSRMRYARKHFSATEAGVLLLLTMTVEPLTRLLWSAWSLDRVRDTLNGYKAFYRDILSRPVVGATAPQK